MVQGQYMYYEKEFIAGGQEELWESETVFYAAWTEADTTTPVMASTLNTRQ